MKRYYYNKKSHKLYKSKDEYINSTGDKNLNLVITDEVFCFDKNLLSFYIKTGIVIIDFELIF